MLRFAVVAACLGFLTACDGEAARKLPDIGAVQMSLPVVPADVSCLAITFVAVSTVDRREDVVPGGSTSFTLEGLPLGPSEIRASAYEEACSAIGASPARWQSAPVAITLAANETLSVTLVLERTAATVDAGPMTVIDAMVDAAPSVDAEIVPPGLMRIDISAGRGERTGLAPSAVIDRMNAKLLVTATDGTRDDTLALYRCELDGTGCHYVDISGGQRPRSGYRSMARIDTANAKLLVVTDDRAGPMRYAVGLTRCELDGSACSYTRLTDPAYEGPELSSIALDMVAQKLLVATSTVPSVGQVPVGDQGGRLRCDLDGSSCTFEAARGRDPVLLVHSNGGKLYEVGMNGVVATETLYFEVCKPDRTGCIATMPGTSFDITSPFYRMLNQTRKVVLVQDALNARVLAVLDVPYSLAKQGELRALRCNLDGLQCEYLLGTAAGGPSDDGRPQALIDESTHQLLVVVTAQETPWLYRCNLDLSTCAAQPLALYPYAQILPSVVLDESNHKLLVVTQSESGKVTLTKVDP